MDGYREGWIERGMDRERYIFISSLIGSSRYYLSVLFLCLFLSLMSFVSLIVYQVQM